MAEAPSVDVPTKYNALVADLLSTYAQCAAEVTTVVYLRTVHEAGESFEAFCKLRDEALAPLLDLIVPMREDCPECAVLAEQAIHQAAENAVRMVDLLMWGEEATRH